MKAVRMTGYWSCELSYYFNIYRMFTILFWQRQISHSLHMWSQFTLTVHIFSCDNTLSDNVKSVCWSTTLVQTEISQQLLDGLLLHFLQTFMFPSGWIVITLGITWFSSSTTVRLIFLVWNKMSQQLLDWLNLDPLAFHLLPSLVCDQTNDIPISLSCTLCSALQTC